MTLTKEDREALRLQVHDDWFLDSTDNEKLNRMRKRAVQLWDAATDVNTFPEHEKSNFHVPLTQWQILAKLAKEVDALLGDEAEVVVRPIGPADAKLAPKVSRYMNWRGKGCLKVFKKVYEYVQEKSVMGGGIGVVGWGKKEGKGKEGVANGRFGPAALSHPLPACQYQQRKWSHQEIVQFQQTASTWLDSRP